MFYVYLLESTNKSTYVGATVDLDKRLRQHNKEIKGGAVATSSKVLNGEIWSYHCYVENFPAYNEALKFEWRWTQISRQIQKTHPRLNPVEKRLEALKMLLNLDKSTTKAIPYSSWPSPPEIVWENHEMIKN